MQERRKQGRASNGHFLGFWARLNCENIPVIPAWLVRSNLSDPRKIPYLLIWKRESDGEIMEAVRLARQKPFDCVELNKADTYVETEKEHAVIELGGAAFREITNGASSFGPSAAVEVTPIKNWLEPEFGTTALFSRHSTEWGTDLVFKKPWDLSNKVEIMLGVGPEWVHAKQNGVTRNSVSVEAVADFMFWHSEKRKFGWYVEPTYEYNFGRGHEQSLGVTGGLLISF